MFPAAFIRGVCRARLPNAVAIQARARPQLQRPFQRHGLPSSRLFSEGKSSVDETIEEIQDQYATARDEFEIAMEETEGNTVYAGDDREAARQEFDKLKAIYEGAVNGPDKEASEEIRNRIGQRIRELEAAVKNMEELAQNQD